MKLLHLLTITFVALFLYQTARAQSLRLKDHSDWWSINNENFHSPPVKPRSGVLDQGIFRIAKLDLEGIKFDKIERTLGTTTHISKGDASTGREQACYRSANEAASVYLIFEFGEDSSNYYLFVDNAPWNGQKYCKKSTEVSEGLSTASGVRLGLPREQFDGALGKPDAIVGDKEVYSREVKKKSTPEQFERQRKEYPMTLSDTQAHEMFDFYTVSTYVEARFTNSKLTYLVVSTSGE
jgi:hypothetical protein